MDYFTWALILLVFGLVCLVLEFFVPSSGMLGALCALSLIAAIVLGFMSGTTTGAAMLLGVLISVPAFLFAAIQLWPSTSLGKMILNEPPSHADELLPETPSYRGLRDLVGKRGTAKSLMLPGGIVQIEGKNYDAISEGTPIEPGQRVLVVQISTQRLVVRGEDGDLEQPAIQHGTVKQEEMQRDSRVSYNSHVANPIPLEAPPPADIADPFAEEEAR
ncbi:NfeD family protein [Anatilimnocola floriformis]|uniref:NfeD family protein n=1 Tax=Anatilimnocola floriformis TaxID=2948575 RepID=UPI0020C2550D|nr:NfeD family protein [Anatilimnocola floriformis]